ncbi:LysE family translocator [Novosphingobium sp. NDB2Meth1]|uniref:LysE family translocator n=1 Tax=Novosphingobium sp. NDB2Meth1 TaxID=1892847 RepID=UPI000A52C742|nr:LysE family translocator [Novosphingobium sp. NDB2Meth1]
MAGTLDIAGFAAAVLLIELTPGPNMAWLAGLAATEGKRSGLSAVAGIALGLLANGVLAALGLATLLKAMPALLHGLRIAGAAMMVWLAIEAWRGAEKAPPPTATRRAFATGALLNLLNPKAYLFFVVVAPEFLGGRTLGLAEALTLALVSTGIATLIHLAIVLAGSRAQAWLADPARTKWVRRGFAVVMLCVAASFLAIKSG